jgi:DNA repair exonuclease SbcCD nuclease subunit
MTDKPITLVHSADWHYGYRQYGIPAREQDMYDVGWFITNSAIELQADAVILAGDTFDMQKPPAQAVRTLCDQIRTLKEHGIPVLGIDGNHDSTNGAWLEVCGAININKTLHVCNGASVIGLHFYRPAVFLQELKQLADAGTKADILVIHQPLAEFADFNEGGVSAADMTEHLRTMGVKHVAMGDIHAYKETVIGGIRWVYPGSPEVTASDERPDKTFSVIRYDGDWRTAVYPITAVRPLLEITLDVDSELDAVTQQIFDCVPETAEGVKAPVIHLWYEKEAAPLARQVEGMLRKHDALYRSRPIARTASGELLKQMSGETFDRSGALGQLHAAVEMYFPKPEPPETAGAQYELVFQCLDRPDDVDGVIGEYLKNKGVEVDGITTV